MELRVANIASVKWFAKGLLDKTGMERKKALRYAVYAVVPVLLLAGGLVLYGKYSTVKRSLAAGKADLTRIAVLKEDYLKKKSLLDAVSAKAASASDSPVAAFEEISSRVGIKEKIVSIKPLEEKAEGGYVDKPVEVKLEGIDLNQLVNLLYNAETGRYLMTIRDISIKGRFENQDLLDASMKVSLVARQ